MRALGRAHLECGKEKIPTARQQRNRARGADQVGFYHHRLRVAFLLRMLRRGDALTELTRVIAIERFCECFRQRRMLRVLHDHRSPRDRLQHDPVRADRNAKREDQCCAGDL